MSDRQRRGLHHVVVVRGRGRREAEDAGTAAMDSEATMTLWEQRGLLAEPLRRGYERRWHHGAGARTPTERRRAGHV